MTDDQQRAHEIAADEQWLHDICKEPPAPSLDRIKLRVRIAAQESWLSSHLSDGTTDALIERTKASVRAAVGANEAELALRSSDRRMHKFVWWSIGVASAAAALLFAFIVSHSDRMADPQDMYVDAFESVSYDDFEAAIDTLSAQVDGVESTWSESTLAQADDWMYLNIGDGLDELSLDPFADDYWLSPDGLESLLEGSGT